MSADFKYEFTPEGRAKLNAMHNIPKATRWMLENWLAGAALSAANSARQMQKSGKGKKSGQMARNVGFIVKPMAGGYQGIVGTGVNRKVSVKYADIQDKGGLTKPEVTARSRKFFWAMFFKTHDDKWKGMALTKKTMFNVFIPRSHWFTSVIESRQSLLAEMLKPANVLNIAEKLGGK